MMRAITRAFHKVEFVPSMQTSITGQIIRWNAHHESIAAKITRPLLHVVQPDDEWSRMRRASIAEDSWLVGEKSEASEYWDWWD